MNTFHFTVYFWDKTGYNDDCEIRFAVTCGNRRPDSGRYRQKGEASVNGAGQINACRYGL